MAVESIAKTLGSGSGIDLTSLVTQLVEAQFAAKTEALTKRNETLTAQISSVSALKSGIAEFDNALKALIRTGSLSTQPTSTNTGVLKVSALTGANVSGLTGNIEVRQIAAGQTSSSSPVADRTAQIGAGKLTLTFGSATVADGAMTSFTAGGGTPIEIDIADGKSSLDDIVAAINAKDAGVRASVLSDGQGSRLVIKSATGASQAFTLTATEIANEDVPGLATLNIGVGESGTAIGSAAADAIVALDGVVLHRTTNSIIDLVPGVRLDLVSASPGTRIALGTQAPTEALGQAVGDVVDTYNQLLASLKEATDPISGPLRADPSARALLRSLSGLTTQALASGVADGTPTTLAAIGVSTNRDGSLSLDNARLTSVLAVYPGNVEAMFKAGSGLSAALGSIATAATSTISGLGASEARYTKAQSTLGDDQEKAVEAAEALRTRMTRQFARMDSAVAAYKSTQTMLQNQIDAWNSDS